MFLKVSLLFHSQKHLFHLILTSERPREGKALLGEDEYQYIWGTGEEPIQLTYSFTSASTFQLDDVLAFHPLVSITPLNLGFDTALDSGQFDPYFLGFNNDQKDWIRQSLDDWGCLHI